MTTKLLSKAAISNEYMIFYHFMILVDIIHSKRQKSYLYKVDDLLLIKEDAYSFRENEYGLLLNSYKVKYHFLRGRGSI